LKIPNGLSEAVNQRRTDNTMTNRRRKKGQNMIYKTLHTKLKVEHHEHHYKPGMNSYVPETKMG